VPFFTNDPWEAGSFVPQDPAHKIYDKETFGIDLYGFDKYVIFCPNSRDSVLVWNTDPIPPSEWGEWDPKEFKKNFDQTENKVRAFGGGAARSPIFIPELQGGWFNHYKVPGGFDDVYNYFGEDFTKMIAETASAQGSTAFSIYMFYGGTNWGTLGDPDVYTSYDYSACIREYGFLSSRGCPILN
jgi:hypothetical protein